MAKLLVEWPVQGGVRFRAGTSELVLSDVYWMWIVDALSEAAPEEPFVVAWRRGYQDPQNLVENLPVRPELVALLRQVSPSRAGSFELLRPSNGPTPPVILTAVIAIVSEAVAFGTLEAELF